MSHYDSASTFKMPPEPSLKGWWWCCLCGREVNPIFWGQQCPECNHSKCANCGPVEGTPTAKKHAGIQPLEQPHIWFNVAPLEYSVQKQTPNPGAREDKVDMVNPYFVQKEDLPLDRFLSNPDHERQLFESTLSSSAPAAKAQAEETIEEALEKLLGRFDPGTTGVNSRERAPVIDLPSLPITLSRSSSIASIAESVFSSVSKSSMSSDEGYEGASERLAWVIFNDATLRELWQEALARLSLARLERNLGRLLILFAKDLRQEANSAREQQVARFVKSKACLAAHLVCEELVPYSQRSTSRRNQFDLSGDSETDEDGDESTDLQASQNWIINSQAFETFKVSVRNFIKLPEVISPGTLGRELWSLLPFHYADLKSLYQEDPSLRFCLEGIPRCLLKVKNSLLKNPPLKKGMRRVTWTCSCGTRMYDDYEELEKGAAKKFERVLRKTFRTKRVRQCSGPSQAAVNRAAGLKTLALSLLTSIQGVYQRLKKSKQHGLPFSEVQLQPRRHGDTAPTDQAFLLLCVNDGIGASIVKAHQPLVHDIDSDKMLFYLLKKYHDTLRRRWWSWMSLWELQQIIFVHFFLYERSLVDIKEVHAIPPEQYSTTYNCERTSLKPPIGSQLLMHFFRHPEEASGITPLFRKVPKKIKDQLTVCPIKGESEGWGLQFREGWSCKKVLTGSCLLLILASMAAWILYWHFQHSIQDAMAIATFMLTCFTVSTATLQAWLAMS